MDNLEPALVAWVDQHIAAANGSLDDLVEAARIRLTRSSPEQTVVALANTLRRITGAPIRHATLTAVAVVRLARHETTPRASDRAAEHTAGGQAPEPGP